AFEQAHTLKGVCANMGLISLLESVSGITEILRSKSYDGLKEEFEKTEKLYSDTVNKIKELIN
ncbi:MAG TPA: Hpt domain-containing protein, partial [Lachnospiraceae bacterium]|nr:Hpt domain-containing protein [Lachnospiraceae bacterium]